MAFGFTTIEFDNPGPVIGPEKMRQCPYRGVRVIGTAPARVARRGKGAELVLELAEPAHMMHLALRVPYRDRLGANSLAAACGHKAHRRVSVRRLYGRTNHLASEIAFGHDAIGAKFMEGYDRAPAPDRRRLAAGKIRENIAIAIKSPCRDDDSYLVRAQIIASRGA